MKFDKPIIGIEMHIELRTNSKMFCGCPADHFSKDPNTQTCPVCLGLPGAMPVPNKKAIEGIIMIGHALKSKIALESKFDRKHYFYPDLPKGFQLSQYDMPLCQGGYVETSYGRVELTRAHMEEDTGKLVHRTIKGRKVSLVDFNRSGVPLVEIVTEPVIHSADQAKAYAKNVAQMIRFLGVSDADMEKGSMRLEANVSWGMELGYKVEVKNINSFNFLAKAIEYELDRQKKLLQQGQIPVQETRGYNEDKGITFSQRTKEEAADYRYFPEPDIPPMVFKRKEIEEIKERMPELPRDIQTRWAKDYQIKSQYYDVLLATPEVAHFADEAFELAANAKVKADKVANEIVNTKLDVAKTKAKDVVKKLQEAANKITDVDQLSEWVDQAIQDNPGPVEQYKAGKESILQFFVGQVMKASRGKASPPDVMKLLKEKLSK